MLYFPYIERKSPIFFDLSRRFCVKILTILIEPLNLSARLSKGMIRTLFLYHCSAPMPSISVFLLRGVLVIMVGITLLEPFLWQQHEPVCLSLCVEDYLHQQNDEVVRAW